MDVRDILIWPDGQWFQRGDCSADFEGYRLVPFASAEWVELMAARLAPPAVVDRVGNGGFSWGLQLAMVSGWLVAFVMFLSVVP